MAENSNKPPERSFTTVMRTVVATLVKARLCSCSKVHSLPECTCSRTPSIAHALPTRATNCPCQTPERQARCRPALACQPVGAPQRQTRLGEKSMPAWGAASPPNHSPNMHYVPSQSSISAGALTSSDPNRDAKPGRRSAYPALFPRALPPPTRPAWRLAYVVHVSIAGGPRLAAISESAVPKVHYTNDDKHPCCRASCAKHMCTARSCTCSSRMTQLHRSRPMRTSCLTVWRAERGPRGKGKPVKSSQYLLNPLSELHVRPEMTCPSSSLCNPASLFAASSSCEGASCPDLIITRK